MRRLLLLATVLTVGFAGGALAVTAPPQPKTGPGGIGDADGEVAKRALGTASATTYAFYLKKNPAEPKPVVVFLHAWGAVNPSIYGGWIDHLVRNGFLVLYPAFQTVGRTRPVEASEISAGLVRDALAALARDPDVKPDLARLIYLGHSAGAGIAVNLAVAPKGKDLPVPKLVYAAMPGGIASDDKSRGIQLGDLSEIDPATDLVTMVGDREFQAADRAARRILRAATSVPQSKKLFLRAASDDHGFPSLSATLASPASPMEAYDSASIKVQPDPPVDPKAPRKPQPRWSADMVLSGEQTVLLGQLQRNVIDALDWAAYWRSFDVVATAAFEGADLGTIKADSSFSDMGRWTDGWPVRRMVAEVPKAVDPSAAPVARVAPAPTTQPVLRRRPRR